MGNFEHNKQPQHLRDVANKAVQAVVDDAHDNEGLPLPELNISDEGVDNIAAIIDIAIKEQLNNVRAVLIPLLRSAVGELANGVWEEALARAKLLSYKNGPPE